MLLAFDIGNTNVVIGCFQGNELVCELRLKSDPGRTTDEYEALIWNLLSRRLGSSISFSACIISSVVPPLTPDIARLVKDCFKLDPIIVGPGIKTGLSIRVPDPAAVGSDRIVNAVAAKELFGLPALVIDFGTATSIDFISQAGSYEGGIIAAGPKIALDALVRNTAKLPRIEMSWPKSVIGKGTVGAMQSGAVLGYACMVDGLIQKAIEEVGQVDHIVATGGLGRLFSEHSKRIKSYDPHLTLKGLRLIAEMNKHV